MKGTLSLRASFCAITIISQVAGWAPAPVVSNVRASQRRRLAVSLSLAILLALLCPVGVHAQFCYKTNNNSITITCYSGSDGNVVIPDTIDGLPVTSIGDHAFSGCTRLTNVIIPNSVTTIGYEAFYNCTSLTSITFGNNVTSIGRDAFYYCFSLTNVVIPNSVTTIEDSTFYYCTSLTSVTIGNSVTTIGHQAFYYCTRLTSVLIPDSVTTISNGAFDRCTSLTSVTIGNRVTTIGARAFDHCTSLTAILADPANSFYSSLDGVLFNKSQTTLIQYPGGKTGSYTIPNSVTTLGNGAFDNCTSLTSVTIGNSVTSIGVPAFASCTSLAAILADQANSLYSSLDGVLFNKSQTTLIQYPAGKAGSYIIPNSVTTIGNSAFYGCTSLTNATIGNGVTNIGNLAFYSCSSLTAIYFRGNTPHDGGNVFVGANNNITNYYLPGTTNWGSSYSGRPTARWRLPFPVILNIPPSFGVKTNNYGFRISWATNASVVVETCVKLGMWSPIATNIISMGIDPLTDGWTYFSDPEWTNFPARFYRIESRLP